jgi:hypothetical protein
MAAESVKEEDNAEAEIVMPAALKAANLASESSAFSLSSKQSSKELCKLRDPKREVEKRKEEEEAEEERRKAAKGGFFSHTTRSPNETEKKKKKKKTMTKEKCL